MSDAPPAGPQGRINIAVRLPNWLGDVVMASSFTALVAERCKNEDVHITAVIRSHLSALARHMKGVDSVIEIEDRSIRAQLKLAARLKEQRVDHYYCLPDSFSSLWPALLAGCPKRTGYSGQLRSLFLTRRLRKQTGLHRVEEYCALLEPAEQPERPALKEPAALPSKLTERLPAGYILFNFNSEAQSRQIPAETAAAMIDRLHEFTVVFTGTAKEKERTGQVIALCRHPNLVDLTGQTSLEELLAIVNRARAAVSTDSGLAHLAAAYDKKLVVLFGAGEPANTGPFKHQTSSKVLNANLECSPCIKNTCRFGLPRCLQAITPDQVYSALHSILYD